MSRFRSTFQGRQVCHRLELPEVLRQRRVRRSYEQAFERGQEAPAAPVPPAWKRVSGPAVPPEQSESVKNAIAVLEKRLLKLAGALEDQESLLLRMRQQEGADAGIASTYRQVQGLKMGQPEVDRKRDLMRRIFQSNQELRERITSLRRLAE